MSFVIGLKKLKHYGIGHLGSFCTFFSYQAGLYSLCLALCVVTILVVM